MSANHSIARQTFGNLVNLSPTYIYLITPETQPPSAFVCDFDNSRAEAQGYKGISRHQLLAVHPRMRVDEIADLFDLLRTEKPAAVAFVR